MIGPRVPRSWLEHLDDEDVVATDEIASWVSQDLLKTCTYVETVSESDYCQIRTTVIVTGDVNAMYKLDRAHRRQWLAARALNERFLLIRGPPSSAQRRLKTNILTILSSSAFCNFQTYILIHRPSKCSEPMLCMIFPDAYECGQVRQKTLGEDGSTVVRAQSGFPLERWVSLMLVTVLISAVGVNRTLLRRLLGGWAFALAFRRAVFASRDVSYTAAIALPPSRGCRLNGALLDELVLVTGLAPFWKQTCEWNPAKHSALQMPHQMVLALHGRKGSPCTIWPRRKGSMFTLIGKAKHHRATCTIYVQPLRRLL